MKKAKQEQSQNIFLVKIYALFGLVILLALIIYRPHLYQKPAFTHALANQPLAFVSSPASSMDLEFTIATPTPTLSPKNVSLEPTNIPPTYSGYCLNVPVLMYHHIQPEETAKTLGQTALTVDSGVFDMQMQYLSQNGYTTLFASDFINALINHTTLPAKSVVITIDDGYEDNYIYALPILQKYGLRANIMLATGLMGNSNMLSWDEVRNLKSSGLIYFTNHTWSHYAINNGSQAKIEYELDTAKNEIEQYTGQTANVFTYPYGAISDNAIATLQKKGYIGAFSEISGTYQCDSFLETLHRTRIGNGSLSSYGVN